MDLKLVKIQSVTNSNLLGVRRMQWFDAVRAGNDNQVAELLAEQPNLVETKDPPLSKTALHFAAQAGHEAIVTRLLAVRPALLLAKTKLNWTALDLAAANGHDKVVAQMLATDVGGLDISLALRRAVAGDHEKVVDLLLTAQSPNFILPEGHAMSALHIMAEQGNQNAFTRLLEIYPSLIDAVDDSGATALHHAARYGHDDMVSQILALRPQMIDAVSDDGRNVLMCAVRGGNQNITEKLLAIKPELIFHVSAHGDTVLHQAAYMRGCGLEFVAKLWRLNPQALTQTRRFSESPFSCAVKFRRDELIELFQWSLSFDDIVGAFTSCNLEYQERYRPVMEQLCEPLFVSLNRDVVGTVLEYVGIDPTKRMNKRTKLS